MKMQVYMHVSSAAGTERAGGPAPPPKLLGGAAPSVDPSPKL